MTKVMLKEKIQDIKSLEEYFVINNINPSDALVICFFFIIDLCYVNNLPEDQIQSMLDDCMKNYRRIIKPKGDSAS